LKINLHLIVFNLQIEYSNNEIEALETALKYADEKTIPLLMEQIDLLKQKSAPVEVQGDLFGNTNQLKVFTTIEDIPELTKETVSEGLIKMRKANPDPQLTFLSFGGGQDSFAILYKLIKDNEFRKEYAPNDLVVVMSDTGNEFPYTYQAIEEAKVLCKANNIPFKFLTSDMGFHTRAWPNLTFNLEKNRSILSATMGVKACTGNLKINPCDKYLNNYLYKTYGGVDPQYKKRFDEGLRSTPIGINFKNYFEKFNCKVRVIIGFAKDEEMRVIKTLKMKHKLPKWKRDYVDFCFPLIEKKWNREAAQDIIKSYHKYLVPPSNCMLCFYQSDHEVVWLERNYPEMFKKWIDLEKNKLDKDVEQNQPKSNGVYGKVNLIEKLALAKAKYDKSWKDGALSNVPIGEWTDDQLYEYKLSHGHCVNSNF